MDGCFSIIIPCYNEEAVLHETAEKVSECAASLGCPYEILYVDDGSRDGTADILRELAGADPHIRYISFSRNFGKESAMLAGLRYAKGEAVLVMDADLQHPPELFGELLRKYEEGYDQVIACRDRTGDSWFSRVTAKYYYKLVNRLVDVKMQDGAGDFRLLSRRAVDALISLPENNRFSKGLFSWIGFQTVCVYYKNRERAGGKTKWSFRKLLSYGLDGILSFNNKPLRLCIWWGILLLALGCLYLIYLFISILLHGIETPGYFTIILLTTVLGGTQLISLGIIGEYIGRIYFEVKGRPNYIIRETNIPESGKNEAGKENAHGTENGTAD